MLLNLRHSESKKFMRWSNTGEGFHSPSLLRRTPPEDLVKKVNTIQCRADVCYWKPRQQFSVYQSRQRRGAKANRINTCHGKHLSSFVLFPSANIWCSGCVWESDPPGKEINDASQFCRGEREHHLECQVLIEIHMFHSEEYQYVLVGLHNA